MKGARLFVEEMAHVYFAKPAPKDRKMRTLALELIGGHWPFPGTYRDQPKTVQEYRQAAIEAREIALTIGARQAVAAAAMPKGRRGR